MKSLDELEHHRDALDRQLQVCGKKRDFSPSEETGVVWQFDGEQRYTGSRDGLSQTPGYQSSKEKQ
ncbi:MAG: hypothetical protein AB7K71_26520 [Polyangiaceae bacterium]